MVPAHPEAPRISLACQSRPEWPSLSRPPSAARSLGPEPQRRQGVGCPSGRRRQGSKPPGEFVSPASPSPPGVLIASPAASRSQAVPLRPGAGPQASQQLRGPRSGGRPPNTRDPGGPGGAQEGEEGRAEPVEVGAPGRRSAGKVSRARSGRQQPASADFLRGPLCRGRSKGKDTRSAPSCAYARQHRSLQILRILNIPGFFFFLNQI